MNKNYAAGTAEAAILDEAASHLDAAEVADASGCHDEAEALRAGAAELMALLG